MFQSHCCRSVTMTNNGRCLFSYVQDGNYDFVKTYPFQITTEECFHSKWNKVVHLVCVGTVLKHVLQTVINIIAGFPPCQIVHGGDGGGPFDFKGKYYMAKTNIKRITLYRNSGSFEPENYHGILAG